MRQAAPLARGDVEDLQFGHPVEVHVAVRVLQGVRARAVFQLRVAGGRDLVERLDRLRFGSDADPLVATEAHVQDDIGGAERSLEWDRAVRQRG